MTSQACLKTFLYTTTTATKRYNFYILCVCAALFGGYPSNKYRNLWANMIFFLTPFSSLPFGDFCLVLLTNINANNTYKEKLHKINFFFSSFFSLCSSQCWNEMK